MRMGNNTLKLNKMYKMSKIIFILVFSMLSLSTVYAPAPALRLGPQVERPGCGRVARGCARLRGARGAALSPPSELSALFHGKLRALRARGRASPGGRVQGAGK